VDHGREKRQVFQDFAADARYYEAADCQLVLRVRALFSLPL
jgi:hypothetical protein